MYLFEVHVDLIDTVCGLGGGLFWRCWVGVGTVTKFFMGFELPLGVLRWVVGVQSDVRFTKFSGKGIFL